MRFRSNLVFLSLLGFVPTVACSSGTSDSATGGAPGAGGAGTGGTNSGGAGTGGATGGATLGGSAAGGASGGDASGGSPSGGANSGGTSDSGGTASGGDASGGASNDPVMIENVNNVVTFTWGDRTLVVDGSKGARIISFKIGTKDIIFPAASNADNYGSTFWTSPQSDWDWPPVAAIDTDPYTTTLAAPTANFVSGNATVGTKSVAIEKHITVDPAKDVVTLEYVIKNLGASTSLAPWEITRVKQGGLTFFPTGAEEFAPEGKVLLPLTKAGDVSWFQHAASSAEGKVSADAAEGWLAHADGAQKLLLIKSFPNLTPDQPEGDSGEVEIYASKPTPDVDPPYVEVENQGAYAPALATDMSKSYTVQWLLRPVPDAVTIEAGSAALVEFVESQLTAAGL